MTANLIIPSAICSTDNLSFLANFPTAKRAASISKLIAPPNGSLGKNRPRTTLASVTVGSVPPFE